MAKKISEFFKATPKIGSSNSHQDNIKDSSKNSEDDENICKFCGIAYLNLSMHIKKVHSEKVKNFSCKICDSKFSHKCSLNTHIKSFHTTGQNEKFECDFDGKVFKAKQNLKLHMKVHLPDVECYICHKVLKFNSLKSHLRETHATDQNVRCKICSKLFKSAKNLHIHEKVHNKNFQCKICKSMQPSQGVLNRHIKLYHANNEIYKCETCKKEFRREENLKKHQKIHDINRPKPFKCHRCDYETDRKDHFEKHQKFHENQEKKFASMKNPLKCEKCPTFHRNKHYLIMHMKSVHPKVQFQCDLCARFVNAKSALKSHMKVHIRK